MASLDDIIKNKVGKFPSIREFDLYEKYKPDTIHKDVIYFATDHKKIYLNGEPYNDYDIQLNEILNKIDSFNEPTVLSEEELDEICTID